MERIATGRVRTSHGVRGYLKVEVFSDDLEHFLSHRSVVLSKGGREKTMEIEDAKVQGGLVLVKFSGVDSPEAARAYNGWDVLIDKDSSSPLEAGEYYYADLQQCEIILEGRKVGTVVSVIEGPQAELLEVQKDDGSKCCIPFMNEYVGEVDIRRKTIEVLHGWILE